MEPLGQHLAQEGGIAGHCPGGAETLLDRIGAA